MNPKQRLCNTLKGVGGKILLVIVSCLGFLLIMEISLRFLTTGTIYLFESNPHYKDENGWFRLKPQNNTWWYGNRYEINSLGFRMNKNVGPKSTFRILAIGDSITLGMGVVRTQDVWPTKLEFLIKSSEVGPAEVINSGVQGWNLLKFDNKGEVTPAEFTEFIEREGKNLKPDIIVYCICLNDIPSLVQDAFQVNNAQNKDRFSWFPEQYREWFKRLAFYRLLRDIYREIRFRHLDLSSISASQRYPNYSSYLNAELQRLKSTVESINAILYCVIVPYSYQLLEHNQDMLNINKTWQESLANNKIPFTDITGLMNEETVLKYYALGDYIHLNSRGHELIAQEVLKLVQPTLSAINVRQKSK